jgi:hypothetical protein
MSMPELSLIAEADWNEARRYLPVIRRLAELRERTRADVECAAKELGCAVLRLQSMLVAIKRAGMGIVPGLGPINWETLVALSALWVDTVDYARERLFAEIVHDLDLPPERRLLIDWPTNYGTLVLLT